MLEPATVVESPTRLVREAAWTSEHAYLELSAFERTEVNLRHHQRDPDRPWALAVFLVPRSEVDYGLDWDHYIVQLEHFATRQELLTAFDRLAADPLALLLMVQL